MHTNEKKQKGEMESKTDQVEKNENLIAIERREMAKNWPPPTNGSFFSSHSKTGLRPRLPF